MDTIFALATARGKAGVAIVRLSGPQAHAAAGLIAGELPPARRSAVRVLRSADGAAFDQALVLSFNAPHSFTGEDVVEFQVHGSAAVTSALLDALAGQPGLRLAEPGEFTRRALENERLDLAQVEGLSDLIEAETEAQRRQAYRVLSGDLGRLADGWRTGLIRAAALIEAAIDFADEEVPVDVSPEVLEISVRVQQELDREIVGSAVAERVREGFEVAIVGAPNAGKSTLLNALAGRDAAIISDVAGTTRDVLEVRMDLRGLAVTILDTAGLRESNDKVEKIGVGRALERAETAELRIFLLEFEGQVLPVQPRADDIIALGKADLNAGNGFAISGKTGLGLDTLIERVCSTLEARASVVGTATKERHRLAMLRARSALDDASALVLRGPDSYDIAAEELRNAVRALDSLVGRVDVEQILDEIFASFCLGK